VNDKLISTGGSIPVYVKVGNSNSTCVAKSFRIGYNVLSSLDALGENLKGE